MQMQTRVKTTQEVADKFKQAFAYYLGQRTEPKVNFPQDVPNQVLCESYESLSHAQKRGIWPQVAQKIGEGRDEKWAAKHYLNSFRRALYPQELTVKDKEEITELCRKLYRKTDKRSIVDEVKLKYSNTQIFPDAIQSFVFQTLVRLEREKIPLISPQVLFPTDYEISQQYKQKQAEIQLEIQRQQQIYQSTQLQRLQQPQQVQQQVQQNSEAEMQQKKSQETQEKSQEEQAKVNESELSDSEKQLFQIFKIQSEKTAQNPQVLQLQKIVSTVNADDRIATLSRFISENYNYPTDFGDNGGF